MDTKFLCTATLCLDKKLEDFISIASIDNLKSLIPAGLSLNDNLVPFVGNLWVANLSNGNGDTLNTETTLHYYKLFENTKIDLEHNFETVIGHIVSVHLTSFDNGYKQGEGSKILKEKDVAGTNDLFNVAVVGVLYKECAPAVIDKIVSANDKQSDDYLKCSLSWETKFSDYSILLGHSVGNGQIVTDPKKILELTPYLRGNKGSGKLMDGTPVNRLIVGEISPMGGGITLNPAAKVAGIIVSDATIEEYQETKQDIEQIEGKKNNMTKHAYGDCPECGDNSSTDTTEKDNMVTCGACGKTTMSDNWATATMAATEEDVIITANQKHISDQLIAISSQLQGLNKEKDKKTENNISHLENASVTLNDNNTISNKKHIKMKFIESYAALEKVTDEDLKEGSISVANVLQVVKDGIKQANLDWTAKVDAEKLAVAAAKQEAEDAKKTAQEAKASAEKLQSEISKLQESLATQEAEQKFQLRMNGLNDKYELDDEYRAVVATDLKDLSDEDFDKYAKKFAVIAKHLNKETIAAAKTKDAPVKKDAKEVVKAALENAEIEKETVPNTPATDEDVKSRLKASFSAEKLIKKN